MTKKLPKEIRAESLLMAAVDEFMEKGYEGASMDSIARRAGVSKGGLYHHFANKEILLMEANRKLSEPIYEMAEKAWSNESAKAGLIGYINDYLKYWSGRQRELGFFFLSMYKALESPLLIDFYKEYEKQSADFFTGLFKKAVESGEMDVEDPEAYGISLMGALDALISYQIIHPEEDAAKLIERVKKVWFR